MEYYVGLDLGTTSLKSLVYDADGRIAGESSVEVNLEFPADGWVEQEPSLWYETSCALIRSAVERAKAEPRQVRAIGISSQGISVVPVDRQYNPLSKALSWLDMRAKAEIGEILCELDEDTIYAITGKCAIEGYSLAKLRWLKKNRPSIYAQTHCFLMPMDYALCKLTGVIATDHTMAGGTMAYDIEKQAWSGEMLCAAQIREDLLPPIRWAGEIVGNLNSRSAHLCGLTQDTLLVNGGQDQKVASYGAGLREDVATISIGTAAAFEFLFDKPTRHPAKIPAFSYLEPGKWVLEGCVATAGAALKWVRNTLFPHFSYDELNVLAEQSPPGSNGVRFLPFLTGGGNLLGSPAYGGRFDGLKLSSMQADLVRAVFESLAYEIRLYFDAAQQQGARIRSTNIFGGGSKGDRFCQIISDITGRDIRSFSCPEMGALGAAKLAARACGVKIDANAQGGNIYVPDARRHAAYEEHYGAYCRMFAKPSI